MRHFKMKERFMNSTADFSQQPPDISGILRYERVANLEAALHIKERRQKEWWSKAALVVAVVSAGVAAGGLVVYFTSLVP